MRESWSRVVGSRAALGRAAAALGTVVLAAVWCLSTRAVQAAELGPKELFEVGGISNDQIAELRSAEPWNSSCNETLRRMLFRIQKDVRPSDLERWSLGEVDLGRLAEDPGAYALAVFRLKGRVLLAEPYRLSAKEGDEGDLTSIWRCRMELDRQPKGIDVFTARVPKAWKTGEPIDEPSEAWAFFVKASTQEEGRPAACFLAGRMAWYPPTYLGRLGMDVGLLDDVDVEPPPSKAADGSTAEVDWESRQLTERDHECFYRMLKAAGTAKDGQIEGWAREELAKTGGERFSVVPLFNSPQNQKGRLVELKGSARRIIPVRVSEADVNKRLGITQYYQVYLFTEDSQDNPIVFCLHQLPAGLPTGDGPDYVEDVSIAGFFFKTWSYRISAGSENGRPQRQLAPLLIGKTAVWYPARPAARLNATEKLVATVVVLLVLGATWWMVRRFRRGDREYADRMRRRKTPGVGPMDWKGLDSDKEA